MKPTHLFLLLSVLAAGGGAGFLALSRPEPSPAAPPPPNPVDQLLVAAHALDFGTRLSPQELSWRDWPGAAPEGGLLKSAAPDALNELNGMVTRANFLAGEPIRRDKLIRTGAAGFLAAALTPGYRAVAVTVDTNGATTAGNFILPNDRVDVLRVFRDDEAAKAGLGDAYASETVVANVRVLAIGQTLSERAGQPTASGVTATLELDPSQAEAVVLAQRGAQLSLALRALDDSRASAPTSTRDHGVTIVRAGVATQSRGK